MDWIYLIVAGFFEMFGVLMINELHNKKSFSALALMLLGFGLSFFFLSLAMMTLPMGTAYAVWTGIGASGSAIVGMVWYKEPADWRRILFISLIVISAAGLKWIA